MEPAAPWPNSDQRRGSSVNGGLQKRNDEFEIITKDSDHRGQRAGGIVTVRMQPTAGDDRPASGHHPGSSGRINNSDGGIHDGADSHRQPVGPHVDRHDSFVTTA